MRLDGRTEKRSLQPERRRTPRGETRGEPPRDQLTALILGTYREMPGLSLTLPQAARLFGLRDSTCEILLAALIDAGKLRRTATGHYVRG
jgi:hypothetical protein